VFPAHCILLDLAQHLADLLGTHIGGSPHNVRNSMELINTL
jgi:hypothetical protein